MVLWSETQPGGHAEKVPGQGPRPALHPARCAQFILATSPLGHQPLAPTLLPAAPQMKAEGPVGPVHLIALDGGK